MIGIALSYFLWFGMVARLPAATASIGVLLVPVVGVAASMAIIGEQPSLADGLGFVLITAAVFINVREPPALTRHGNAGFGQRRKPLRSCARACGVSISARTAAASSATSRICPAWVASRRLAPKSPSSCQHLGKVRRRPQHRIAALPLMHGHDDRLPLRGHERRDQAIKMGRPDQRHVAQRHQRTADVWCGKARMPALSELLRPVGVVGIGNDERQQDRQAPPALDGCWCPVTTNTGRAALASALSTTWRTIGLPAISHRSLLSLPMRVERPAASTMAAGDYLGQPLRVLGNRLLGLANFSRIWPRAQRACAWLPAQCAQMLRPERQHSLPGQFGGGAIVHVALLVHKGMLGVIAKDLRQSCRRP